MPSILDTSALGITNFAIEGMMMRYSVFVPRLYNFCKSLGFSPGKMLPSRAFCSDESQGFPVILIAKHFGSFPFNHGQVGGIVATDRHAPHADHGKDMVIIQASHVGYDPDSSSFGSYRRLQTEHMETSSSCGKIDSVIKWYQDEYQFAAENIRLEKNGDSGLITIDNQLLNNDRSEGIFLYLEKMLADKNITPIRSFSTAKQFLISDAYYKELLGGGMEMGKRQAIADKLTAPYFYFRREIHGDVEGQGHLERNLLPVMPSIVTSKAPLLTAAMMNTQLEFDRTFRTLVKDHAYLGKNVLFIAGLNIDISPDPGQMFPLTKFVPWAAYIQNPKGVGYTLEQEELVAKLKAQSQDNPDQVNLEDAINEMVAAKEIQVRLP